MVGHSVGSEGRNRLPLDPSDIDQRSMHQTRKDCMRGLVAIDIDRVLLPGLPLGRARASHSTCSLPIPSSPTDRQVRGPRLARRRLRHGVLCSERMMEGLGQRARRAGEWERRLEGHGQRGLRRWWRDRRRERAERKETQGSLVRECNCGRTKVGQRTYGWAGRSGRASSGRLGRIERLVGPSKEELARGEMQGGGNLIGWPGERRSGDEAWFAARGPISDDSVRNATDSGTNKDILKMMRSLYSLCPLDLAVLLDLLDLPRQTLALGPPPVQRPPTSDESLESSLSIRRVSSSG